MKKNKNRMQAKRAQRKHAKTVGRKGRGALYGAMAKQLQHMPANIIEQVVVQGTDSREVLNTSFVDDAPIVNSKKDNDTIIIS